MAAAVAEPTGQKWSNPSTQRPLMGQCLARSGRTMRQLTQTWPHCPALSAGLSRSQQRLPCPCSSLDSPSTSRLLLAPPPLLPLVQGEAPARWAARGR